MSSLTERVYNDSSFTRQRTLPGQVEQGEIINVREEAKKKAPSFPLASVLHDEYAARRRTEVESGKYTPGKLLSVQVDQPLLRELFIAQGRKNIRHEVKNAFGNVAKEGTPIDWYNPTHPFVDEGDKIMAVRLEPRDCEVSFIGFIKENPDKEGYSFDWTRPLIENAQDPSITSDNNGNHILSVVSIQADENDRITGYNTTQFRGPNVRTLSLFHTLPGKDNRPIQLQDRVRAFLRPQGEIGGAGKLAVRDYPDWEQYKADLRPLTPADLLEANFVESNHGGPNFPLPDGQVYGHIADKVYDKTGSVVRLQYYVTWMLTDLGTGQLLYQESPMTGALEPLIKVITDRSDFPESGEIPDKDSQNPQKIHDVVFTSGIEHVGQGRVRITTGISDTRIGVREIDDPMLGINISSLRVLA